MSKSLRATDDEQMSEHTFKLGHAVCLKSGGPTMTVIALARDASGAFTLEPFWFTSGGKMQKGFFQRGVWSRGFELGAEQKLLVVRDRRLRSRGHLRFDPLNCASAHADHSGSPGMPSPACSASRIAASVFLPTRAGESRPL